MSLSFANSYSIFVFFSDYDFSIFVIISKYQAEFHSFHIITKIPHVHEMPYNPVFKTQIIRKKSLLIGFQESES